MSNINKVYDILNNYDGIKHDEYKEFDPEIPELTITLKAYQKRGLSWLIDMEDNGHRKGKKIRGGLLCDEMGLGKRIQIIALMLSQEIFVVYLYLS